MQTQDVCQVYNDPVVIGGVGGSGTRLIAGFLRELGYKMGSDLNEANDNLWFTLLFIYREILGVPDAEFDGLLTIYLKAMSGADALTPAERQQVLALAAKDERVYATNWYRERAKNLLAEDGPGIAPGEKWGWKTPNSHMILHRLLPRLGRMRYIHVARNGLDMAHSTNQQQLKLWGSTVFGETWEMTPLYSLKFWCFAHRRILELGAAMGENFLFLNYDKLCRHSAEEMERLCTFLGGDGNMVQQLAPLIRPPASMGRFKAHGLHIFAAEDVAYVRSLGFDTD